ncbi:MAG TPA: 16S rRNA (guanine(966)-N(2))-methyltransferase RsmD [Nevskiaceae bacterium]|nr:16S rRNA (guanine(966)-N(2))-methyltransferase RsmD [Nevskiaceae bacterium]
MTNRSPGRLRIIGGNWRSRVLDFDTDASVRPTPDRVRQTLFDWLAPRIEGAVCLDLFAGSGALGLEALSRGAARATFVESDARPASAIRAALAKLGATDRGEVVAGDALAFLRHAAGPYEIVFLDPPYASGLLEAVLPLLVPQLARNHRIYLEWPGNQRPPLPDGSEWLREKRAGQVSFGLATLPPQG